MPLELTPPFPPSRTLYNAPGDFHETTERISLGVTIYLVFQAVTPSFFGSMSDSFGRRPIYVGTLIVYMGANIGLALMPTSAYWLLLVLRALQVRSLSSLVREGRNMGLWS